MSKSFALLAAEFEFTIKSEKTYPPKGEKILGLVFVSFLMSKKFSFCISSVLICKLEYIGLILNGFSLLYGLIETSSKSLFGISCERSTSFITRKSLSTV